MKRHTLKVIAIFVAVIFFVSMSGAYVVESSVTRLTPIYSVKTDKKEVSISFDCAWGVDYTLGLLDTMDKYNVKCTFFAVEFWVTKYPEYAKQIVERGHDLGTHSKTHPKMSTLNKEEIMLELNSSISAIEKATGVKPTLFRPPYGDYSNTLIECANGLNIYTIQWDVDSLDWKNLSKSEITKRVVSKVKNGSIILCHNNGLHTLEALPMILSSLIDMGYTFKKISELIYKDNYYINSNGEQIQNGV